MKVLLVNGSTREKGCTYTALTEVEKILNEENIETEIFHTGTDAVYGCRACGACSKLGKCVLDDVSNKLAEKMQEAYSCMSSVLSRSINCVARSVRF